MLIKVELVLDIDDEMKATTGQMSDAMQQLLESYTVLTKQFYRHLNRYYHLTDMPYGDTHEGFMQWLASMQCVMAGIAEIKAQIQACTELIDFDSLYLLYCKKLTMEEQV
jgi:hypothetical protein